MDIGVRFQRGRGSRLGLGPEEGVEPTLSTRLLDALVVASRIHALDVLLGELTCTSGTGCAGPLSGVRRRGTPLGRSESCVLAAESGNGFRIDLTIGANKLGDVEVFDDSSRVRHNPGQRCTQLGGRQAVTKGGEPIR